MGRCKFVCWVYLLSNFKVLPTRKPSVVPLDRPKPPVLSSGYCHPDRFLRRKEISPDCGLPLRKRLGSISASLPPNLSPIPALNMLVLSIEAPHRIFNTLIQFFLPILLEFS